MRLLQVLAGAAHGGAETAFVDMCCALHDAGEQVEVVTRPNPLRVGRLHKQGITVHELPFGGSWDFYTSMRIRKIATAFSPHIVQTWMSRAAQRTPRWDSSFKCPHYLTVARLGGYYKTRHFKNSDYFTTITPDIRRYLIENGIEAARVRHINNFAETEQVVKPASRAALDTPDDATLLLALGRLHEAKAFDTLQKAVKEVPDVYLWIAGEGPDRAVLEELCAALDLTDRVRFLGWREDRAALFKAADICVFPSRYEPFGTVFVQAWAQKTPLVTTASDGPRQYVRDGEDGLVVPVDDVPALAAAITRLATDQSLAKRLINKGFDRYRNEFTKDKTVQAYLDFYHHILEREGLTAIAEAG